ncbi:hypothetical protein [Xanthobacter versatilis]|uniref:hypothetical protein n=1 Tax=Xanthobacter autotrophicus (strain ATCC BAA-1158 / Py2) TaxID=78245 RepID=UPI0037271E83
MSANNTAVQRRSPHRTQWAAQFAAASELCKRGYEVAFTMGNHPTADLMVYSPKECPFIIDVKGLYRRNYWLVKEKPIRHDVFYIFALVPEGQPNRFFILNQAEVNAGVSAEIRRARAAALAKGRSSDEIRDFPGVAFSFAEGFEDAWHKLPA